MAGSDKHIQRRRVLPIGAVCATDGDVVPVGLAPGWATHELFLIMIEPGYRDADFWQRGLSSFGF